MSYKIQTTLIIVVLILFGFGCTKDDTVTKEVSTKKPVSTKSEVKSVYTVKKIPDLIYSNPDDSINKLDLYIPDTDSSKTLPVIVYIHGGGWIEGTKNNCPGNELAKYGYAVACIDYRLATKIGESCIDKLSFPAQIHDVKASVRWISKNAEKYNINKDKIIAMGASSGAHLASLLGVSNGDKYLQGNDNLGYSDKVHGVIDWYGPTDYRYEPPKLVFTENICTSREEDLNKKYGGEETAYFYWTKAWGIFLGGGLNDTEILKKGKLASPLTYIDKDDPPFLIIHGQTDDMVPIDQSKLLYNSLKKSGVNVQIVTPKEMGHGYYKENRAIDDSFLLPTLDFLKKYN